MPHKLELQKENIPVKTIVPGRETTEDGDEVRASQSGKISPAMLAINKAHQVSLQIEPRVSSEITEGHV